MRIVSCYDNEWGYASRVVDVANFLSECNSVATRPERVREVWREQVEQALYSLWL